MFALTRRAIAVALVAALCVCGGQAAAGGVQPRFAGMTPADRELASASDDYQRTVTEGAVLGVVVGAIAGGLIGRAVGGNSGLASGILLGGGFGGLAGRMMGRSVADNKAAVARQEDQLDAEIAAARTRNAKLARIVKLSHQVVAQRRSELAALRLDSSAAEVAQKKALLARARANRDEIDASIAAAQQSRDKLKASAADYRSAALSRQIGQTEGSLIALRSDRKALDDVVGGLK